MIAVSQRFLRWYLGSELRRLRENSDYSRQLVAQRLGRTVGHLSHIEVGRNLASVAETREMLTFYGQSDRIPDILDKLAAAQHADEWWSSRGLDVHDWFADFLACEGAAQSMATWHLGHIPGLLQTPLYAKAVIHAERPALDASDVQRRVDLRMARQDVLYRQPEPPSVAIMLDESVLRRIPGDPDILIEQIAYLVKMAELPTVSIQIVPASSGLHPGLTGGFTILEFADEWVGWDATVYTETLMRGSLDSEAESVAAYRRVWDRLQRCATGPGQAVKVLNRIAEELSS